MKILSSLLLFVLLASAYCRIVQIYPDQFLFSQSNNNNNIEDLSNIDAPILDTQNFSNDKYEKALQILLKKIHELSTSSTNNNNNVQQTVYFLIKALRQRNKRYSSPLTYCHFKLCNMGRKRADGIYKLMNLKEDNEES